MNVDSTSTNPLHLREQFTTKQMLLKEMSYGSKVRNKRLEILKNEKENEIQGICTFTPKTHNSKYLCDKFIGGTQRNNNKTVIEDRRDISLDTTPTKVNYKAINKFVNRQALARCMKKEKQICKEKLESGSVIDLG